MWKSHVHDDELGPLSARYRNKDEEMTNEMYPISEAPAPTYKPQVVEDSNPPVPASSIHPNEPYPGT